MTIQERIAWARRLTLIQIIITVVVFSFLFLFLLLGAGAALLISAHRFVPFFGFIPMGGVMTLVVLVLLFFCIILPLLTYVALGRAHRKPWGVVAYSCLILSLLVGNFTPLSLLPLAALILLIDGPTFTYLTESNGAPSPHGPAA